MDADRRARPLSDKRLGLAWALLALDAGLCLFALLGSVALKSGQPVPDWDYGRLSSAVAVLNILAGLAIALLHMSATEGSGPVVLLLGLCVLVAGSAELAGTLTGFPFGEYHYTTKLGPRFVGEVPYLIPLAWFMMAHASLSVAGAVAIPRWCAMVLAASMLVLWDVALDPAMTADLPAWGWTEGGAFYGIPLSNYVAWSVVALMVTGLYLSVTRPAPVRPSKLPWALYVLQSIFPAALAAVYGRGWATLLWVFGFVAILATWIALRRAAPASGAVGAVGR